jgi:hypothetical protein
VAGAGKSFETVAAFSAKPRLKRQETPRHRPGLGEEKRHGF